ncbi:MAG: CdaR family protein, partial [Thermomicrobiales bacterium]
TLDNETQSFSQSIDLIAVDSNNQPVENVTIEPSIVRVRVELEVRGKEVPVFVQCECDDAADGYVVLGLPQATPANVIIDGPPELLDQVQFVYTTPVNTSGLDRTTVIDNVPLDIEALPDNVSIDPAVVDVSVRVEQTVFTQTIENVAIKVLGVEPNRRVVVNPTTLTIDISGPRDQLDALDALDIAIVVDVTGLEVGAHQVRPRVVLPPGMTYSDELPQVVVAVIDTTPTPTATARPAPAPTATNPPEPQATQSP